MASSSNRNAYKSVIDKNESNYNSGYNNNRRHSGQRTNNSNNNYHRNNNKNSYNDNHFNEYDYDDNYDENYDEFLSDEKMKEIDKFFNEEYQPHESPVIEKPQFFNSQKKRIIINTSRQNANYK